MKSIIGVTLAALVTITGSAGVRFNMDENKAKTDGATPGFTTTALGDGGISGGWPAQNVITRNNPAIIGTQLPYSDIVARYPEGLMGPDPAAEVYTDTTKYNVVDQSSYYVPNGLSPYNLGRTFAIEITDHNIGEITFPHNVNFATGVDQAVRERWVTFEPLWVQPTGIMNAGTGDPNYPIQYYRDAGHRSHWMVKNFTNTHITLARMWDFGTDAQGFQVRVHIHRSQGRSLP